MSSVSDPLPAAEAHRPARRRRVFPASMAILMAGCVALGAAACPFCESVQQTIRQQSLTMDAVVIASCLDSEATRNLTTGVVKMKIENVLKGVDHIQVGQKVDAIYFGKVDVGKRYLLSGVDPPNLQWSCLPVSERAEEYIVKGNSVSDDPLERLKFYRNYLEDEETLISRDAYDEFASTPYDIIRKLGPEMDRERLIRWVNQPEMSADRKRLYFTMLGVCGSKDDLPMLEAMMKHPAKSSTGGLDAMIACYLTLAGESGLPLINELFIENKKAPFPSSYAAIMAIRFHGTDGDLIPRSALAESLHKVLERPELADMVIPDLAKWNDWSQVDRLVRLFKEADKDNNWLRVPVVNYLRACPLPKASEAIEELEKIDPGAVRRARTFFPIPVPVRSKSGTKDTTAMVPPGSAPSELVSAGLVSGSDGTGPRPGDKYAQTAIGFSIPEPAQFTSLATNRWQISCVMLTALVTVMLVVFLVLTGGAASNTRTA
ncbi:MAG: hypothetical protein AAFV88_19545 [Planctomycetota bacterium]